MDDCDFCARPASEPTRGARVSLERRSGSDALAPERDARSCGDCLAEIRELADGMDAVERTAEGSGPAANLAAAGACGLCGDPLDGDGGLFGYARDDGSLDRRHALCPGCVDVVGTFLENVPEEPSDEAPSASSAGTGSDTSAGDGPDSPTEEDLVPVDEAAAAAIRERFHDCAVGDAVRFEARRAARGRTVAEGTVVQFDTAFTETRMVIDPRDDGVREYHVFDEHTDDRSPSVAGRRPDGSLEFRGAVTAFESA